LFEPDEVCKLRQPAANGGGLGLPGLKVRARSLLELLELLELPEPGLSFSPFPAPRGLLVLFSC
jgi:hypothetical protein